MSFRARKGQAIVEFSIILPVIMLGLTGLFALAGVFVRYQVARIHIASLCEYASYSYNPYNPYHDPRFPLNPPQTWGATLSISVPYLPPITFRSIGWGSVAYVDEATNTVLAYATYQYDPTLGKWRRIGGVLPQSAPSSRTTIYCYLYEPLISIRIPFFGSQTFYINQSYVTYSKWGS